MNQPNGAKKMSVFRCLFLIVGKDDPDTCNLKPLLLIW